MTNKDNIKLDNLDRHYNISISLPLWFIFEIDNQCNSGTRSEFIKYTLFKGLGHEDIVENEKKKDEERKKIHENVLKKM